MRQVPDLRMLRLMVGVTLALLTQGVFAPNAAEASCGHYVVLGSKTDHSQVPVVHRSLAEGLPPTVPVTPCSGLMCSRHTPERLATPPAPANPLPDCWAEALNSLLRDSRVPIDSASQGGSSRPVRLASTIYHPPL